MSHDCSLASFSGFKDWYCQSCVCQETLHGSSKFSLHQRYIRQDAKPLISAKRMYYPQTYHHIQEIQKYNIQDYRPRYVPDGIHPVYVHLLTDDIRMEQFQKAIRKVRQVQRMRKQRGYAFSQADESQTRVLQAYDTTRERGKYGEMASSRPKAR